MARSAQGQRTLQRQHSACTSGLAVFVFTLSTLASCAARPQRSLVESASPSESAGGARCETLLVSHELQIPPQGELADLRLTVANIPETLGQLRVLVRRPRFAGALELESLLHPAFDRILEIDAHRELTVVLPRPENADDEWPRRDCKACRVEVELTGFFGARAALESFFSLALRDADEIEAAFADQSAAPSGRTQRELADLARRITSEAERCNVKGTEGLTAVVTALADLDRARAGFYSSSPPQLPDAKALLRTWDDATRQLDGMPWAVQAARSAGWPASLRTAQKRMLRTVEHLSLSMQSSSLPLADRSLAARWIAVAMAPDAAALERQIHALGPLRDLAEANARLLWIEPAAKVPLPGASAPFSFRVREWRAALHGRRCYGTGGAGPLAAPDRDLIDLAQFLGADERGLIHPRSPVELHAARTMLARAHAILCTPPSIDASDLFVDLADGDLGPIAQRLRELNPPRENATNDARDPIGEAIAIEANRILCRELSVDSISRHVTSVESYKSFLEGGIDVLELLPNALVCDGRPLATSEIRQRLRTAWQIALEHHAAGRGLCPRQKGRCPEATAASIQRIFGLTAPALANLAPEGSQSLDFPPPFGFSADWIHPVDRCASEECAGLARLHASAPEGQFEGPLCSAQSSKHPLEVRLDRAEAPVSLRITNCDPLASAKVIVRRAPGSGTLVAIASVHAFRFGQELVGRRGRHPQLGQVFERVADLTDRKETTARKDGAFEVSLTPTVPDQVFYFFSLRRRDY